MASLLSFASIFAKARDFRGHGGSLIKVGMGTLTLTGLNTYSGGTNINGGILAVNGDANLGTGPLSFSAGTLQALAAGGDYFKQGGYARCRGGTFLADAGATSTLSRDRRGKDWLLIHRELFSQFILA